jgi:hypothetical protein
LLRPARLPNLAMQWCIGIWRCDGLADAIIHANELLQYRAKDV